MVCQAFNERDDENILDNMKDCCNVRKETKRKVLENRVMAIYIRDAK